MRVAIHIIEKKLYHISRSITEDEISNLKKLAEKGLFQCPFCDSKLKVRSGEKREVHFSHHHSESCEESKVVDKAEKKYINQIKRETPKHQTMVQIVYDELQVQSRTRTGMDVDLGYSAKSHLSEFPDVWVKLGDKEFAISVLTNVNPHQDQVLSEKIIKRHRYFVEQGMQPIWFIENKELAIERDKNAIVLWDAEAVLALKTEEDKRWDYMLKGSIKDLSFFDLYNYTPSMKNISIDVRSLYYIYSNDDRIVVKVQRFLNDRLEKPFRSFLINDGYELSFAEALRSDNNFILCNTEIEEDNRKKFMDRFEKLTEIQEKILVKQKEEEQYRYEVKRTLENTEKVHEQTIEVKRKVFFERKNGDIMNYSELKSLLKDRIGLTQSEQMELWTKYMPKIGIKNAQKVWDLVEIQKLKSFGELREILKEK